jgi:hypothetical protein
VYVIAYRCEGHRIKFRTGFRHARPGAVVVRFDNGQRLKGPGPVDAFTAEERNIQEEVFITNPAHRRVFA